MFPMRSTLNPLILLARPITIGRAARGKLFAKRLGLHPLQAPSLSTPTSSPGQKIHAAEPPLKVHIFVDGTWLYYTLVVGRNRDDRSCPMETKFGPKWRKSHAINWTLLPQIIAAQLDIQLKMQHGQNQRSVEVVRTSIFTSALENTPLTGRRASAIEDWYRANFDVHLLKTPERKEGEKTQEKCVDIMIAVEMLYMAQMPNAYDIAVLITGDKDFIPALQKTRQTAKRCAIASVRNSCNKELTRHDIQIRDFDVIWLEESLDKLMAPKIAGALNASVEDKLKSLITSYLQSMPGQRANSREVGRHLQHVAFTANGEEANALKLIKQAHGSIKAFLEQYDEYRLTLLPDVLEYNIQYEGDGVRVQGGNEEEGGKEIYGDVVEGDHDDTTIPAKSYPTDASPAHILNTQFADAESLAKMTVPQLRQEATKRGLRPKAKATKAEIKAAIMDAINKESTSLPVLSNVKGTSGTLLVEEIKSFILSCNNHRINSRDLGRFLQAGGYLAGIKIKFGSLKSFLSTLEGNGVVLLEMEGTSKVFNVGLSG